MTNEIYIKRSEDFKCMMFEVANEAYGIIEDIVKEKGNLDYHDLFGETDNCIYLDNDLTVNNMWVDECEEIWIMVEDNYGECFRKNLDDLNPLERIDVADYLVKRFNTEGK